MIKEKFRVSEDIADEIKRLGLPASSAKLLLAIIYHNERQVDFIVTSSNGEETDRPKWASASDLRLLGLAPSAGSSRFLRKPVDDLSETLLFDFIELSENGRYVRWVFSDYGQALLRGEFYGLVEADDIKNCSLALDAVVLTQTAVRYKMDRPALRLFPFIAPSATRENIDIYRDWKHFSAKEMTRSLKPTLQKWAKKKSIEYHVEYAQLGAEPGYTDVFLRIRHSSTKWSHRYFEKSFYKSYCYTIS